MFSCLKFHFLCLFVIGVHALQPPGSGMLLQREITIIGKILKVFVTFVREHKTYL